MDLNLLDKKISPLSKTADVFKSFYEANFDQVIKSIERNKYYYDLVHKHLINRIPKNLKILDIGFGTGDLLDKLKPSDGVGIDLCSKAIKLAKEKHPKKNLSFIEGDIYNEEVREFIRGKRFDVILLINTVVQLHDVIKLFKLLHEFCHNKTRIYIYNYSKVWQPLVILANILGLRVNPPSENWLPPEELRKMFYLADMQEINIDYQILFPFYIPLISTFINKFLAHLPFLELLCMKVGFTVRPIGEKYKQELPQNPACSVVIPCRNEAGHIYEIINRMPDLGPNSEYIFVEGNSTDNTEEVINSAIKENPDKPFTFIKQTGKGLADAIRLGFSHAKGDIFVILDGDITVVPEDLPPFIEALVQNKAEFINGSRLIYPMEQKAMRFLNLVANKLFALIFTYLFGQQIRDTLCGTKVLWKNDYIEIAKSRSLFGEFDPFGDFDLLFGASRLGLKIVDLPVRYTRRIYGESNISRFRDGVLLLKMTYRAFTKLKMT